MQTGTIVAIVVIVILIAIIVALYLEEKLDALVEKSELIETRRGKGFMQGLVMNVPVGDVIKKCMAHGLIVISAGGNVLRL